MEKSLNKRTIDKLLEIKNLPESNYDYSLSQIHTMLEETMNQHNNLVENGEQGTLITEEIGLNLRNLKNILIELGKEEGYFPFCKISIEEMSILEDWFVDRDSISTKVELILKDDENNRLKAMLYIHLSNRNPKSFYKKGYELINLISNKPFSSYPKRISDKFLRFLNLSEYYLAAQFPAHFGDEILEVYFNHLLPVEVLKNTFAENN